MDKERKYLIDVTLDIVKGVSSSEPVLFQRGGALYIVSAEAFGQVNYGLVADVGDHPTREEFMELEKSKDLLVGWDEENSWDKKPVFVEGEKKYINLMVFGSDWDFSFEDLTDAGKKLLELPGDGKIRMVDWRGEAARIIDREEYLDLMRQKEDSFYQNMFDLNIPHYQKLAGQDPEKHYSGLDWPDCAVMTPVLLAGFPRPGSLNIHELDAWGKRKRLERHYEGEGRSNGDILYHEKVSVYRDSPFTIDVKVNLHRMATSPEKDFEELRKGFQEELERQLSVLSRCFGPAEDLVKRLNKMHNELWAKEIKTFK